MNVHSPTWEKVSTLLREARDSLPSGTVNASSRPVPAGPLSNTCEEFEEFLEHNELELAWDALAEIAKQVHAPSLCWKKLAQAARLMELFVKAEEADRRSEANP
jgi:hypothetical protein